jgi:hypothetical protein
MTTAVDGDSEAANWLLTEKMKSERKKKDGRTRRWRRRGTVKRGFCFLILTVGLFVCHVSQIHKKNWKTGGYNYWSRTELLFQFDQ